MWCVALLVFGFLRQTLGAPAEKPVLLFSCPRNAECYAYPPNCVDNCNAAFSMQPVGKNKTTFNIAMLSGLGYVAVLAKYQGKEKYERAFICSFHHPRGITANVNYPNPIVVREPLHIDEPVKVPVVREYSLGEDENDDKTSEPLHIDEPVKVPVVREYSSGEDENDDKASETYAQKNQFDRKLKEEDEQKKRDSLKRKIIKEMEEGR
ncbi:unnamed protein product [Strongylus vulgaris]|uniref:Uncharacterized protein n=1 Tax=Strongylus vulgaris TaxID=40348 RepID=A0A3P7J197_STRVU|nr:unnamed protein product [Strongylus vulgaris]